MRRTKKFIVTVLIITLILGIVPRQVVFAQEADPTPTPSASPDPTPSPTPDPTPNPTPNPTPDPSPSPTSGLVVDPSPTPTPTPCPTGCDETPAGTVDQTNSAAIDNQVTDTADTGNNTVAASPTPSLEITPTDLGETTDSAAPQDQPVQASTTITTGDALAEVNVVNMANTNTANSQTDFEIQNIYGEQTGDIVLTDTSAIPQPSLLLVNQQNTATITNYIIVYANSGWNLVTGGLGEIQTGAAYATVNVFNFINANLANSQLSFAIINIFGNLTGNIVLPEPDTLSQLLNGAANTSQSNTATVNNTINSGADTGNNTVAGSGQIETGNATSVNNLVNYANSNMIGGSFYHLIINNFGFWDGQFVGWGNLAPEAPRYGQMIFDVNNMPQLESLLSGGQLTQQNDASVTNVITASANTGNNQIQSDGSIKTGNAFSTVNLLNFINSNWSSTRGFFGLINILGSFKGDIGGADHFITETVAPIVEEAKVETSQPETRALGGQIAGSIKTNVGTHVNPLDTVMFYIDVQNTGTGPIYNGKVVFNLIDSNGELGALQNFDIGKLDPGKKVKISFGLALSNKAPQGTYLGLFKATGNVGPDNAEVTTLGNTLFEVGGSYNLILNNLVPEVQAAEDVRPPVQQQQGGIYYSEAWSNLFLLLFFLTYIRMLQLLYRKREDNAFVEETPKEN